MSILGSKISADFIPSNGATKDIDLHLATLGFDLATRVTAGENGGRDLRQDFVVLSLANEKMSGGKAEIGFNPDSRARALAAWITVPNQIQPIQAVGGWLR